MISAMLALLGGAWIVHGIKIDKWQGRYGMETMIMVHELGGPSAYREYVNKCWMIYSAVNRQAVRDGKRRASTAPALYKSGRTW